LKTIAIGFHAAVVSNFTHIIPFQHVSFLSVDLASSDSFYLLALQSVAMKLGLDVDRSNLINPPTLQQQPSLTHNISTPTPPPPTSSSSSSSSSFGDVEVEAASRNRGGLDSELLEEMFQSHRAVNVVRFDSLKLGLEFAAVITPS